MGVESWITIMPLDPIVMEPAGAPLPAAGTKVAAVAEAVSKPAGVNNQALPAVELPDLKEAVRAAAQQIDSYLRSVNRMLEFRIDAETGVTVITVRETATGEVIRQIPGEEVLRLARHLQEGSGTILNIAV